MKTCSKCGIEKPLTDFYADKRNKMGYRSYCKECHKTHVRNKYWTMNPKQKEVSLKRTSKNNSLRRRERRTLILRMLVSKGCTDCGIRDPLVLDFDHVFGKTSGISCMVSNHAPWKRIEEEITKCEVRCSNCHRRKTAKERGYYLGIDLLSLSEKEESFNLPQIPTDPTDKDA